MKKKRASYSTEFKQEAASLVLDKDYSIPEACGAMGVGYTAMRRWVNQLESERGGTTPEAKIKQIEWEKEILRKATALLMSDTIKR